MYIAIIHGIQGTLWEFTLRLRYEVSFLLGLTLHSKQINLIYVISLLLKWIRYVKYHLRYVNFTLSYGS